MRIRRTVIIPVILALGTAASSLAVSAAPAMATVTPAAAVASGHAQPGIFYRG